MRSHLLPSGTLCTTYKILHISDLHVSEKPRQVGIPDSWTNLKFVSTHDPDILEAIKKFVADKANDLDLIAATGDLATTGHNANMTKARDFVDGLAATVRASANPRIPIFLLPGNHDRFSPRTLFPGGNNFDASFASEWCYGQGAGYLTEFPLNSANGKVTPSVGILAADFSLHSVVDTTGVLGGTFGQGIVHKVVLDALVLCTKKYRDANEGASVIWMMHFPPQFPKEAENLSLIHGADVMEAARENGVLAILAGHTHDPFRYVDPKNKQIQVFTAGTSAQFYAPSGNWVHVTSITVKSDGTASASRSGYRWDDTIDDWQLQ